MKKIFALFFVFMLITLVACKQQESKTQSEQNIARETTQTAPSSDEIPDVDDIESGLDSDELDDMDNGFSDIENI